MALKDKSRKPVKTENAGLSTSNEPVESMNAGEEPVKKLIVEIPQSLHRRLKIKAVQDNITIKKIVQGLLEKHL